MASVWSEFSLDKNCATSGRRVPGDRRGVRIFPSRSDSKNAPSRLWPDRRAVNGSEFANNGESVRRKVLAGVDYLM